MTIQANKNINGALLGGDIAPTNPPGVMKDEEYSRSQIIRLIEEGTGKIVKELAIQFPAPAEKINIDQLVSQEELFIDLRHTPRNALEQVIELIKEKNSKLPVVVARVALRIQLSRMASPIREGKPFDIFVQMQYLNEVLYVDPCFVSGTCETGDQRQAESQVSVAYAEFIEWFETTFDEPKNATICFVQRNMWKFVNMGFMEDPEFFDVIKPQALFHDKPLEIPDHIDMDFAMML